MSEEAKKHFKGGGYKKKAVDNGSAKKRSLAEFSLNSWKDLRPALEEGATAEQRVTAIELISSEPIKVKLNLENYKSFRLKFRNADKRFKIFNKINSIKKFNHYDQINFLILNKHAHKLYLSEKLKYDNIIDYIFKNLKRVNKNYKFRSLNDIVKYVNNVQNKI